MSRQAVRVCMFLVCLSESATLTAEFSGSALTIFQLRRSRRTSSFHGGFPALRKFPRAIFQLGILVESLVYRGSRPEIFTYATQWRFSRGFATSESCGTCVQPLRDAARLPPHAGGNVTPTSIPDRICNRYVGFAVSLLKLQDRPRCVSRVRADKNA